MFFILRSSFILDSRRRRIFFFETPCDLTAALLRNRSLGSREADCPPGGAPPFPAMKETPTTPDASGSERNRTASPDEPGSRGVAEALRGRQASREPERLFFVASAPVFCGNLRLFRQEKGFSSNVFLDSQNPNKYNIQTKEILVSGSLA